MDDREVLATVLDDARPIGVMGSASVMLLGGFPTRLRELAKSALDAQQVGTTEPLDGCLSDFQHNYE